MKGLRISFLDKSIWIFIFLVISPLAYPKCPSGFERNLGDMIRGYCRTHWHFPENMNAVIRYDSVSTMFYDSLELEYSEYLHNHPNKYVCKLKSNTCICRTRVGRVIFLETKDMCARVYDSSLGIPSPSVIDDRGFPIYEAIEYLEDSLSIQVKRMIFQTNKRLLTLAHLPRERHAYEYDLAHNRLVEFCSKEPVPDSEFRLISSIFQDFVNRFGNNCVVCFCIYLPTEEYLQPIQND